MAGVIQIPHLEGEPRGSFGVVGDVHIEEDNVGVFRHDASAPQIRCWPKPHTLHPTPYTLLSKP